MQNTTLYVSDVIRVSLPNILPPQTKFKPTKEFYETIGINKHRYAKMMRNEVEPTVSEIKSLSAYFKFSPTDLF